MSYESVAVVGPTASGKTNRAVALAQFLDGEIISADSRQVYRDMTLGTGKDLEEYGNTPYHLIDICEAGEKYNLHRYLRDFRAIYSDILSRRKVPVVCGGTGMYVENALSGISMVDVPENAQLRAELSQKSLEDLTRILETYRPLHNTTDVDTAKRAIRAIEIAEYYSTHPDEAEKSKRGQMARLNTLVIGMDIPRDKRREAISRRLHERMEQGMLREVVSLLDRGMPAENLIYYGLEYKYLTLCAIGQLAYDDMIKELEIAIHQFAKRQMTWFRGMEKRGTKIHWIPYDIPKQEFIESVSALMKHN